MARHHKKIRKTNRGNYKKKFHPFPFCENEEIEVTIEGLTHLGHGVARLDHTAANGEKVNDWVVFIPFALPNEKVRAKVTHNGKSNSLAELCDILKPSSERVEPKCRHFFYCGGCHFQHLDYNAQLTYQTEQVTEQLKRLAGIEHPVKKPITTDKIWNYRSKLTPHLQQNKNDKNSLIGFHHHTNKEQIVGIQRCEIAMEPLNDVLQQLKKRPSLDDKSSTTLMRINGDKVETEATNAVSEKVGNITFHFLAGDFFQNNPFILEPFIHYVKKIASASNNNYLIDAYCGCGFFALSLASEFKTVLGIEISETSADWARFNANFNGIKNTNFHAASAEKIFAKASSPATETTVVIDPPRAGCSEDFLEQLFTFKPSQVIYVSCDPATQVRDLAKFIQNGYSLQEVQPFDLFPHTRHLECVITLELSEE